MAKTVILAVAGSGKTYHICHSIDLTKKNLILAFTHENLRNIRRELCDANGGKFPELTNVMTFDSFLYSYIIEPYEPSIFDHFNLPMVSTNGVTFKDPPPNQIFIDGRYMYNPAYKKKDTIGHYITRNKYYYCATLAELIMEIKQGKETLIKRVAKNVNLFYDQILVDEFQDFREYDYDLICALAKNVNNITLIGDYYQHSVSAKNNTGRPFEKRNKDISYSDFIEGLKPLFIVDDSTMLYSRRCSEDVCNFVSKKLQISIQSQRINNGSVYWVDESQIDVILCDENIKKIIYNDSSKYLFNAVNWSYSKGDTYNDICVILTKDFEKLDNDCFDISRIKQSTINKLYVAFTRTKSNLYIMKQSLFVRFKNKYLKEQPAI